MLPRSIGLVAAAGVVCAAAIIPAVPAAASSGRVGIVVSTGSSTVTKCVSAGGTGMELLTSNFETDIPQSGPYAGFVVQINQVGKNPPDTTHYWSYWHSSGNGDWTYSGSGPASTHPKTGTVDGWSYVNGRQQATSPPKITYGSICGAAKPKPTPTATPEPRTQTPTHTAVHATAHPTAHTTAHTAAHSAHRPAHHATPSRTAAHTPAPTPTSSPSTASSAALASPTTSALAGHMRTKNSSVPAWGTIIAVIVVLALGGAAGLRLRHRPE